jgi:hypothetical protein
MRPAVPVYGESPGLRNTSGGGWELLSGHSARRRPRNRRAARVAAPLGVPMALGLTLGIILALSGGNGSHISQSSLGSSPKPPAAAIPGPLPASPSTVSSGSATCRIVVPARPLSARGLSTPYQLSGCTASSAASPGGVVQATILDPATGALSVYDPPVITAGNKPAVRPAVPRLPPHAIVTIDFSSNGPKLIPAGATPGALAQGHCASGPGPAVSGPAVSGGASSCNGAAFFAAALALMRQGRLHVPSEGTSARMVATGGRLGTGRACPNVRNFEVAGQDQAGSLVDDFIDPAFGCQPFTAPSLGDTNAPATSRALDELLAAGNEPKVAARLPRAGQPGLAAYCQNLVNLQAPFLAANSGVLATAAAPGPAAGTNLFTFLASRLSASFSGLGCRQFGLTDPVTLVRDQAGAATSARLDTTPQQAAATRS